MPPFPIYVIPYPLPIVPSPGMCPCYLLNPGNNGTAVSQPPQNAYNPGYAPYGIIGFLPVVFVPYCPGSSADMQTAQQSFPNAVPVPYNCAQCQANQNAYRYFGRLNGGRSVKLDDLQEIKSLPELEDLLKNEIKPPRRSLKRIAVHARVLDDVTSDKTKKAKKSN